MKKRDYWRSLIKIRKTENIQCAEMCLGQITFDYKSILQIKAYCQHTFLYFFSIPLNFNANFKSLPKEYLHKVKHNIKHCNPYSNLNKGYSCLIITSI